MFRYRSSGADILGEVPEGSDAAGIEGADGSGSRSRLRKNIERHRRIVKLLGIAPEFIFSACLVSDFLSARAMLLTPMVLQEGGSSGSRASSSRFYHRSPQERRGAVEQLSCLTLFDLFAGVLLREKTTKTCVIFF